MRKYNQMLHKGRWKADEVFMEQGKKYWEALKRNLPAIDFKEEENLEIQRMFGVAKCEGMRDGVAQMQEEIAKTIVDTVGRNKMI